MTGPSFRGRSGARNAVRVTRRAVIVAVGIVVAAGSVSREVRAGVTVSDTWTPSVTVPHAKTDGGLALAQYDGLLYAAWLGQSSPYHVYYSAFNGSTWTAQRSVPTGVSSPGVGPALAVYNGDLYVVWGGKSSHRLWYSAFNGAAWTSQARIPSALTEATPALGSYNGSLYLLWTGQSGSKVWYSSFNGTTWTAQATVPSAVSYADDAGVALAAYDTQLFASWGGPSDAIWYASFNGTKWSTPGSFASQWLDGPALAVNDGLLYAAWIDFNSADVFYAAFDGSGWTTGTPIPSASSVSGPALASYESALFAAWNPVSVAVIDYSSGP
jgi:hypothetical protein